MLQTINTYVRPRNEFKYSKNTLKPQIGEIWWADVPNAIGSQQGGRHPFLIISNNIYNGCSPMVWALPITSQIQKRSPVHVDLKVGDVEGLYKDSSVQIEGIWNLNQSQLISKIGNFPSYKIKELAQKFAIQFPWLNMLENKIA